MAVLLLLGFALATTRLTVAQTVSDSYSDGVITAELLPALDLTNFGLSSNGSTFRPFNRSTAGSSSSSSAAPLNSSTTVKPASGISTGGFSTMPVVGPISGVNPGGDTIMPAPSPVSGVGSGGVSTQATINGTGWKGTSGSNWSTAANWDSTGPGADERNLFFGNGWVNAGRSGSTTSNNDLSGYTGYRITFENISSPPTFTLQGNSLTLADFGGNVAKIENQSTANQNINFNGLQFAGSLTSAEINAVNGSLTFGSSATIGFGGSVAGIRLYGSGQTVTFNNTINGSGKYIGIATNGTGNTININGSVTASDFSVINNGTLNLNSGGSLTASVRLGIDYTGSGNVNNTQGASFNLTNASGNQTFSGVINSAGGNQGSLAANTSGALAVNSQNSSNTNTLSGHIALDSPLTLTQTAGGTLAISQGRASSSSTATGTDVKTQTLTFSGAGNFVVGPASPTGFGTIYDSTSGGSGTAIIMNGTGSLTFNDANSYRGKTQINSGTLLIGANNALGSSNGTIGSTGNTVLLGNTSGSSNASLLTTGAFTIANAITLQSGNTGVMTLGGNSANAAIFSGAVNLGTASGTAKNGSFVALSGGSVDFQGVIDENTSVPSSSVTIGDAAHTGTVKFSNSANAYGGTTTINSGATLEVVSLGTSGSSSIGNSTRTTATNLVIDGGTLKYSGSGESTTRTFSVTSNGTTLDASGSGAISFSGTESFSGTGNRNFTLTGSSTGSNTFGAAIVDPSSGSTALVKSGTGTWIVGGTTSTYTGATTINGGTLGVDNNGGTSNSRLQNTSSITVNSGGTLLLVQSVAGVSTNRIVDSATVTLNGGTFNTAGLSEGTTASAGLGALTLQANSIIDLGAGSSILHFANSSAATWTSSKILEIDNWSGNKDIGGGTDQLLFGTNTSGLTGSELSEIQFLNPAGLAPGTYGALILSNGEVVPIPESSTWAAGALALAVIGYVSRRSLAEKAAQLSVNRQRGDQNGSEV